MKRSLIYFSIIKIFFFTQLFRLIQFIIFSSHTFVLSFFHLYSLDSIIFYFVCPPRRYKNRDKKVFRTHSRHKEYHRKLYTFPLTFISTFVFDNEHDSASTFRARNVSLLPTKRQFPTDCHRSSKRRPSPKISSPCKKVQHSARS